jgi:hypothetical protein
LLMSKEQLWKWLEGKYVDPQEFKESLESVLNEVERLQAENEKLLFDIQLLRNPNKLVTPNQVRKSLGLQALETEGKE